MAATKTDKNTLLALTSAALALPGMNASQAATIASAPRISSSFGHYEESNQRMTVEIYHADAVLPLNDWVELSFSLDRDTYSGATPGFSIPEVMTGNTKYSLGVAESADIVSIASSGVTATGLTVLGGLNTFNEFVDGSLYASDIANDEYKVGEELIIKQQNISIDLLNFTVSQEKQPITKEYNKNISDLTIWNSTELEKLLTLNTENNNILLRDKTTRDTQQNNIYIALNDDLETQYFNDRSTVDPRIGQLDLAYAADKMLAETQYNINRNGILSVFDTGKDQLDLQVQNNIDTLDNSRATAFSTYDINNPRPLDPISSISSPTTITFQTLNTPRIAGKPDSNPLPNGLCSGENCFNNGGILFGVPSSSDPTAHLHRVENNGNIVLQYHSDSPGIYFRARNQNAFSLDSMRFSAPITSGGVNPQNGPNDFWEILGFNTAIHPQNQLSEGDGTNYATRVAYQTVANGFDGILQLNDQFKNVNSVWIHFHGWPKTPPAPENEGDPPLAVFSVEIDDVRFSPATAAPAQTRWDNDKQQYVTDYNNNTYTPALTTLNLNYNRDLGLLEGIRDRDLGIVKTDYDNQLDRLKTDYERELSVLSGANAGRLEELRKQYEADTQRLKDDNKDALQRIKDDYDRAVATQLQAYQNQLATQKTAFDTQTSTLDTQYSQQIAAVDQQYQPQRTAIDQNYTAQIAALTAQQNEQIKQAQIALYAQMLNRAVPVGNPTVQRFQYQPQETRTMPQFTTSFYLADAKLSLSGGYSDEPDYLSNFGTLSFSKDFNHKLTTVFASYGLTSNSITRGGSAHGASHHSSDPTHNPTNYADLNDQSTFQNGSLGFSQVLGKDTLYQGTINYTHQSGYLSNQYKSVYVRGIVTPEEYYQLGLAPVGGVDWNSVTNGLEMVGIELFREVRPSQRNMWSFANHVNHHLSALDATLQLDYRFYTDDWKINSHTFEAKWFQSLPNGWTVTPGIRYYSQSQAAFFAPYFLAPRDDGHYSSDFRLSGFGDLSGGVTISKQFAPGIKLETGFEYVTHGGGLKLGGGGVGDYADFNYYLAHANLSVELSPRGFASGDGHAHHHHHHGAPLPAGVMFGHMMPMADDFMVGYRYAYSGQSGSMLHGDQMVEDAVIAANACPGELNGCALRPLKMHMSMHMLDLMYAPTDWLNLMVMPQLMNMDMTMSDSINPAATDSAGHAGAKHTSNNLGDTNIIAMVKIMDDKQGNHVHVGVGVSAPTGSIDEQLSPPSLKSSSGTQRNSKSATLQDYGMQTGSGTWDFKPSLTYTGLWDSWSWGTQLSGTKRLGTNKYGYALGDILQATGWGSYQIFDWLSASVRGVFTAQGKVSGYATQTLDLSSPVNHSGNYGGRFWDVGLGLNIHMPDGQFAGHSLSVEWLQPVASDFKGYQLDRDGAVNVTWSYAF